MPLTLIQLISERTRKINVPPRLLHLQFRVTR
jgi:hypothetical protein